MIWRLIHNSLLAAVFTCTQVFVTDTTFSFDRDNTGGGQESYPFAIFGGNGTIIERFMSSIAVAGSVSAQTEVFPYTITAPAANPFTVTLVSDAGSDHSPG